MQVISQCVPAMLGSENENDARGIGQLKAMQNKQLISITNSNYNHASPVKVGDIVVWISLIYHQNENHR